jgi:hypothetical protein
MAKTLIFIGMVVAAVLPASGKTLNVPAEYATISAAVRVAGNGDLVLVAPGVYNEQVRTRSSKQITLASYYINSGDQNDILNTIIDGGGKSYVVNINGNLGGDVAFGKEVVGFTVRGGGDGFVVYGRHTIRNCIVTDVVDAVDYETAGGGVIRDCLFYNTSGDGIGIAFGCEILVENNVIQDVGDDCIEIRLEEYTGPTLNVVIRNNDISGAYHDGIQFVDQAGLSNRAFVIENNYIHDNRMAAIGCMDNDDRTEDYRAADITDPITITENVIANNAYGISGGDNMTLSANTFENNSVLALYYVDGNSVVYEQPDIHQQRSRPPGHSAHTPHPRSATTSRSQPRHKSGRHNQPRRPPTVPGLVGGSSRSPVTVKNKLTVTMTSFEK